MSEKIVQLNEEVIKGQIKELVRGSVEETLNELLEKEAESLTQAARYERSEARQGYRSGHYDRNLTTTSGEVTLHMPRLKGVSFETAIIERYRRRESSVEEGSGHNRENIAVEMHRATLVFGIREHLAHGLQHPHALVADDELYAICASYCTLSFLIPYRSSTSAVLLA